MATEKLEDQNQPGDDAFDRAMREAIVDVSIPEGLAGRIAERLGYYVNAIEGPSGSPEEIAAASHAAPAVLSTLPTEAVRRKRRMAVGAVVCAAAAAALACVMAVVPRTSSEAGPELVIDEARALFVAGGPSVIETSAPPNDYPLSAQIVLPRTRAWHWSGAPLANRRCLAYVLSSAPNARATLFVARVDSTWLGPRLSRFPASPTPGRLTTNQYTTAAWIEGDLLYVLVVEGGASRFHRWVRRQAPLA